MSAVSLPAKDCFGGEGRKIKTRLGLYPENEMFVPPAYWTVREANRWRKEGARV